MFVYTHTYIHCTYIYIYISRLTANFVIRHNFTCCSSNIIYSISCINCCKLNIGETGRRLFDSFAQHIRSVRNNDVYKSVVRHFNAANNSISHIEVCASHPFLVVMIAVKDMKSVKFLKWNYSSPRAQQTIFFYLIPS